MEDMREITNKQENPAACNMDVPYFLHEGELARGERTARRLAILCGILIAVLVGSNAAWIAYIL